MENIEIAKIFSVIADILEIQGKNKYRVGAYRRAAQVIEAMPDDINEIYKKGRLDKIPGVGESLARKIKELIETGKLEELKQLEKKVPQGVTEIMEVEGVGPKLAKLVYKKFGVTTINQLEKLVKSHKLQRLKGFRSKTEENILRGIELLRKHGERELLGKAYSQAESIVQKVKESGFADKTEIAGSLRRRKETIGDIDILVTSKKPLKVMDFFTSLPEVKEVEVKGKTKATVILKTGIEADMRVVTLKSFGAAFHYFTGSKAHNIRIRKRGAERGLKINEYGVFKKAKNEKRKTKNNRRQEMRVGGKTEEEVFKSVELPWIPPELREDRGEIEAAEKGKLPKLIELKDLKGDLHMHTTFSDGAHSIEEMVRVAKKKGYSYIAITDHASPLGILKGLTPQKVLKLIKEVKRINKKIRGIKVLAGAEVDILPSGELYLPQEILKKLDVVIGAIHTSFRMPKKEMTQRILLAIRNPYVAIIAHPTGRILGRRESYELDLDEIMKEAKKTGTILELNAFWNRLDLNDINLRLAKEKGVRIAISTDAHNVMELDIIKYGISQARRGWLEAKDVVNTLPFEKLKKILKK